MLSFSETTRAGRREFLRVGSLALGAERQVRCLRLYAWWSQPD